MKPDLQRPCGEPVNEKLLNLFPVTVDLSHAFILLISEKKPPVQPLCWSRAATTGPWPSSAYLHQGIGTSFSLQVQHLHYISKSENKLRLRQSVHNNCLENN